MASIRPMSGARSLLNPKLANLRPLRVPKLPKFYLDVVFVPSFVVLDLVCYYSSIPLEGFVKSHKIDVKQLLNL